MKPYLLPIFALLIVGCGNQHQQQVQAIFTHKLDSVKQVYIKAFDSMSKQHLHIVDSMKQLLRDTELKLSSAKAQHPFIRENKMDTLVRIRYKNSINGYRVSVLWQPEYVGYLGKIIGKAILNFQKGNIRFSMVHSHFFLNHPMGFPFGDSIKYDKSCIYEIEYYIPDECKDSYLLKDVPFFFVDKGRMLVLNMWAEGQRHTNAYRFYKMEGDGTCIQNGLYQITDIPPFTDIDDLSIIDDDMITIYGHGGMNSSESFYRKNTSGDYPPYKLTEIKEYNYFIDSVAVFTYNIEKRLIKKEYVKHN